jgi:hypothetical protein
LPVNGATTFVRFRLKRHRLQASLIQPRRLDGKVRAEHVAALGSIAQPADIFDRVAFWQSLHERLGTLVNRLPDPGPVYQAIHQRIPMPTADEQRAAMIETAEADARLWEGLRDMHQSTADEHQGLASDGARLAQEGHAARAAENAATASERLAKLKRGEAVDGGLHRPFDARRALRDAGWSERDMAHARDVACLSEAQFDEWLAEVNKRNSKTRRRIERASLQRIRTARASP